MKEFFYILVILISFSGLVEAQDKVYPKNGDRIATLLKRHGRSGQESERQFIELNKSNLGKNNMLKLGVGYQLPPLKGGVAAVKVGTAKKEPLFGKKYENYKILSNELEGAVFYLVSGHGGPDPGVTWKDGKNELHEDEYAYDITLRLARNLMERGAVVHVIIQDPNDGIRDARILNNSNNETCMGEVIPRDQTRRLRQRCDAINTNLPKDKFSYKRAIFIHLDSQGDKAIDAYFYFAHKMQGSHRLAENMQKVFKAKYEKHQPGRGYEGFIKERALFVFNNCNVPLIFAELGNVHHERDKKRFLEVNNRKALANWMCEAIVHDYKEEKNKK